MPLDSWAAGSHAVARGLLDPFEVSNPFACSRRRATPDAEAGWQVYEHRAAASKRARGDEAELPSQGRRACGEPEPEDAGSQQPPPPTADGLGGALSSLRWSAEEEPLRQSLELLRQQLQGLSASSEDGLDERCSAGLESFVETCCVSERHAERAFELLELGSMSEPALLVLSRAFGDAGCAGHAASAFVMRGLLPRFTALGEKPATRGLIAAALGPLKDNHSGALLDHLVLPLLWGDGGAAQTEALIRLAKELPLSTLTRLVEDMARGGLATGTSAAGVSGDGLHQHGNAWSDSQSAILKEVLARKPPLRAETLGALLLRADSNIDTTRASLKFGNAIFTLVRVYLPVLGEHLAIARRVASSLTTFMGKNTLKLLDKAR